MGRALQITRTDYTAAALRAQAIKTRDATLARRLLLIVLILDGEPRKKAGDAVGMDRQIVRDWVIRFNAEGVDGLKTRAIPGRPTDLTPEQQATLRQIVLDGPDPERDGVVRWRCLDLQRVILERFGVSVHESTVGAWLRKLNLTRLQPRPEHPGKCPEAEADFKKTSRRSLQRPWATRRKARPSKSGFRMKRASGNRAH